MNRFTLATFASMFIRRRRNKSGTVSVVVVDKSSGKFRELKTIGVSSDPHEIQELERRARAWMDEHTGQLALDFDESDKVVMSAREAFSHIDRTLYNTTQVILNGIYDSVGFGATGDDIPRHLDISRDIEVSINEDKIAEDSRWDGLKGYVTNTSLPASEVIAQYHGLWVVERLLAIAKTVTPLRIKLPNGMMHCETLYTTPQQEAIRPLVDILAYDARARG